MNSTMVQRCIEALECRQFLSACVEMAPLPEHAGPVIAVAKTTKTAKRTMSVLGTYAGDLTLAISPMPIQATIQIVKQAANGVIKGRMSAPTVGVQNMPFQGQIDKKGTFRAKVTRNGVSGSISGRFTKTQLKGTFVFGKGAQAVSGAFTLDKQ